MAKKQKPVQSDPRSRREFIRTSSLLAAAGAVGSTLSIARSAHAYGSDEIKIGLIGSGGRGTGATVQAINTMKKADLSPNGSVKVTAMADVFGDRLGASFRSIKGHHANQVDVPEDRRYVGFDAYQRVLDSDIDLVILATPPGFRPMHFEAAVQAGKHVFMEKPVATDVPGVRRVLAANKLAVQKNLAVAVGLQRRHEPRYIETVKRIWDGAIGDVLFTRVYWNSGGVWVRGRKPEQTELEYQMRNWYYFNWLCGDHITEQHIHNLDVSNWLLGGYPVECNGMGGREVRDGLDHGQIYDHHFCEYTYGSGAKMYSQCRHIRGAWNNVSEHAHGTKGFADLSGKIYNAAGDPVWSYGDGGGGGHQVEHYDLFRSLRKGEVPNEAEYGAKSTMTSILGRLATYSGKTVKWDDAIDSNVPLADFDSLASMEGDPPVYPDDEGRYPIPVPGKTKVL